MSNIEINNVNIMDDFNSINKATKITFSSDLSIEAIRDFIVKTQKNQMLSYNIKNLPFDNKKILFADWLKTNDIVNPSILLNIIILVRAYNDFTDDFFAAEQVYFNSITDFLDLKLELKEETDIFINTFTTWYYSLFSCIHKVEFNFLEEFKPMPDMYSKLITSLDYVTISGIIAKANNVNFKKLYLVENALMYISVLSQKISITNILMDKFNKVE